MTYYTMRIFIIESDPWLGQLMEHHLDSNPDYDLTLFARAGDCINQLFRKPHLVILSYSLPDMKAEEVLKKIKEMSPETQVVIISGQDETGSALRLLRQGVYDCVARNEGMRQRLWNLSEKIHAQLDLQYEMELLKREVVRHYDFGAALKGSSETMEQTFRLARKASKNTAPVLLSGETGTGKKLLAKVIHYNSPRKRGPFIVLNIASTPINCIESELFGCGEGNVAEFHPARTGKLEEANGGTLFLDEISELDLHMQALLLQALQEREYARRGSKEKIKLDIRIIASTQRNLGPDVKKNRFNEELYHYFQSLVIEQPPLRERGDDVLLLARHFVNEFCRLSKLTPLRFSEGAIEKLRNYNYPGNMRELKAVTELAAVMAAGGIIEAGDISFSAARSASFIVGEEATLKEYSRKIVDAYLRKYEYNLPLVARKLDIGQSTLYDMLKSSTL